MSEKETLNKVLTCLTGDDLTGQMGLIEQVKKNHEENQRRFALIENRLHGIEKKKNTPLIFKWITAIFAAKTGI